MVLPASDFSACFYLCIFTPPFSVLLLYHIHERNGMVWDTAGDGAARRYGG